jgi:hypothetical protein
MESGIESHSRFGRREKSVRISLPDLIATVIVRIHKMMTITPAKPMNATITSLIFTSSILHANQFGWSGFARILLPFWPLRLK